MRRDRTILSLAAALTLVAATCSQGTGPSPVGSAPTAAEETEAVETPGATASPSAGGEATEAPASQAIATPTPSPEVTPTPGPFTLTSSAFEEGQPLPKALTCDGADRSPPLAWTGVPAGAKALVLVVDDPDARDFTHWTVLDLPADAKGSLPAGVAPSSESIAQGRNDFGKVGWGGPCPPSGTHHYRFTLSALAAPLGLSGHPDGNAVRAALHAARVLGRARLTGTYHR